MNNIQKGADSSINRILQNTTLGDGGKKIKVETTAKKMLADVYTPVGIYLRLRDRFRDTVLLESTDHHAAENSYSFICINAIGGIEIKEEVIEFKLPNKNVERTALKGGKN
jgi:anthranilate synthase component 1